MFVCKSDLRVQNNLVLNSALKKDDNIFPVFIFGCEMIGRFRITDTLVNYHSACLKKVIVDINNNNE